MIPLLTHENFNETITQAQSPVLIDFWSDTCGPCNLHSDQLIKVKQTLGDEISIFKVNVDAEILLANEQQILVMPTTKIFSKGVLKDTLLGVKSESEILTTLKSLSLIKT